MFQYNATDVLSLSDVQFHGVVPCEKSSGAFAMVEGVGEDATASSFAWTNRARMGDGAGANEESVSDRGRRVDDLQCLRRGLSAVGQERAGLCDQRDHLKAKSPR